MTFFVPYPFTKTHKYPFIVHAVAYCFLNKDVTLYREAFMGMSGYRTTENVIRRFGPERELALVAPPRSGKTKQTSLIAWLMYFYEGLLPCFYKRNDRQALATFEREATDTGAFNKKLKVCGVCTFVLQCTSYE